MSGQSEYFDLKITKGHAVTPSGIIQTDIGIKDGRIVALGPLALIDAEKTIDAVGLHILPGLIDTQVHFRDPGFPDKETIESGSRAAIRGGVTSFFDMPNTNPATINQQRLKEKCEKAFLTSFCDFGFFIGGTDDNYEELAQAEYMEGCVGVKVFMGSSTGSLLVEEEQALINILRHTKRRIAAHAEDEARLRQRFHIAEQAGKAQAHPEWRDSQTALIATERLLRLAKQLNRSVHILHITTKEELTLLATHKYFASCEITPQHLTFSAPDCYDRLGTLAQMNPPIRKEHHRQALWKALNSGLFDCIGSDHAPHEWEAKQKTYPESPSGMPGVQTLLPVMLNHVHQGHLSLERLTDLSAAGPARLFSISGKGRIAVGFDADLVLVDLKARRIIEHKDMESRCGWTPYDGMEVTGWPIVTLLRGQPIMQDDVILASPCGRPVKSGL